MSRPDRWWRPDTNRRPAGGARRRAHTRRGAGEAFDAGYQAGKADQSREDQRLRDGLADLMRAVDAVDNGDPTLLDEIARQAGVTPAARPAPYNSPFGCPSWCTEDHADPEQVAMDEQTRSRTHGRDMTAIVRDDRAIALVSVVACESLDSGERAPADVVVDARESFSPDEARRLAAAITEAARIAQADADDLMALADSAGVTPLAGVDGGALVADLESWLRDQEGPTL